jgi:hypothetical protein
MDDFMKDRKLLLAINSHKIAMKPIKTDIPQGSPVFPILFTKYILGVFTDP